MNSLLKYKPQTVNNIRRKINYVINVQLTMLSFKWPHHYAIIAMFSVQGLLRKNTLQIYNKRKARFFYTNFYSIDSVSYEKEKIIILYTLHSHRNAASNQRKNCNRKKNHIIFHKVSFFHRYIPRIYYTEPKNKNKKIVYSKKYIQK